MGKSDKIHKLLIVGLDQAGKTSILNVLNEKYNKMDNIKPTVGIERDQIKILGIPIVSWDLGGQEKFRDGYLKNVKIFEQTDSIFFIIDVWNSMRYDEALQYYGNILKKFEKVEKKPNIIVCIHKMDPNLRANPDTNKIIEKVERIFKEESEGFDVSVFVTSIFDRKSIVEAFSRNLQVLISDLKPFKELLKSLMLLLKLDAVVLFDENLMILSDAYREKEIEELCLNVVYNSVYYMTHSNPKLADDFMTNFELVLNVKSSRKVFSFMQVTFKGWNLFLLTMGDKEVDHDKVHNRFESMAHVFEKKEEL